MDKLTFEIPVNEELEDAAPITVESTASSHFDVRLTQGDDVIVFDIDAAEALVRALGMVMGEHYNAQAEVH